MWYDDDTFCMHDAAKSWVTTKNYCLFYSIIIRTWKHTQVSRDNHAMEIGECYPRCPQTQRKQTKAQSLRFKLIWIYACSC